MVLRMLMSVKGGTLKLNKMKAGNRSKMSECDSATVKANTAPKPVLAPKSGSRVYSGNNGGTRKG